MSINQLSEEKRKSLRAFIMKLSGEGKTLRQVQKAVLKNYNVKLDPKK